MVFFHSFIFFPKNIYLHRRGEGPLRSLGGDKESFHFYIFDFVLSYCICIHGRQGNMPWNTLHPQP